MGRILLLSLLVLVASTAACGGPPLPPRPAPSRMNDSQALVEEYYRRVNAEDLPGVMALLVREPVLIEPFSAPEHATTHAGYEAVARFYQRAFQTRDDNVVPEYVHADASGASVGWSLTASEGAGDSGSTRFEIRDGQIARIEIQLRE
jgi:hypothetical protein